MTEAITFHFDPQCPWCYQTSRWARRLDELGVIAVQWRVFSLAIQNWTGDPGDFDPSRGRGIAALRTAVAVRDGHGDAGIGAFYAAIGTRVFDAVEPVGDPATITAALRDAGLDESLYERAVTDPATWDAVQREHHELVTDSRGFGVPTIRLDGGRGPAIFGPVISDPPPDDEAVELWHHVSWLVRNENFAELKREREIDPDLELYRSLRSRQH